MSLDEMLEESREEGRAAEREKAAHVLMRHLGTTYEKAVQLLAEQEQAEGNVQPMKLP